MKFKNKYNRETLSLVKVQLLVIVILNFIHSFYAISFIQINESKNTISQIVTSEFIISIELIFTSSILFYIYNYLQKSNISISYYFLIGLPTIFILSAVSTLISRFLELLFTNKTSIQSITKIFMLSLVNQKDLFLLTGAYFLYTYTKKLKKEKERKWQADILTNEAHLQMIQYQVNPHFLFNSLNTIRALTRVNKQGAREMVTELSEFFRYSLIKNKDGEEILENEIEAIRSYLSIQKMRFQEKLQIRLSINEKSKQIKVPFFIIHPLVENAVKYGLETCKKTLKINISVAVHENNLSIYVMNTGKIKSSISKNGLSVIEKRLKLAYSNKFSFLITEKRNWVVTNITIKDII